MLRRLVALLGHLPGLWLLYRFRAGPALLRLNAAAVLLTLAAMALAGWLSADAPFEPVLWTWAAGHLVWGAVLATRPDAGGGQP